MAGAAVGGKLPYQGDELTGACSGFLPLDVNGSERPHWSGTDCRVWGGMQVSVMQFMITTVDAIQMLRSASLPGSHLRLHLTLLFDGF